MKTHGTVVPPGKKLNGFTGEFEDAPPLNLSASPTDQRILAAPPHTDPLPDLITRAVSTGDDAGIDVASHVGPSLQEDSLPGETPLAYTHVHETPELNRESTVTYPVEHADVASTNARAVQDGAQVNHEGTPYVGLETKEYNDSLNARKEAETRASELPEVKPPVPGDQKGAVSEEAPVEEGDTRA